MVAVVVVAVAEEAVGPVDRLRIFVCSTVEIVLSNQVSQASSSAVTVGASVGFGRTVRRTPTTRRRLWSKRALALDVASDSATANVCMAFSAASPLVDERS